MQSQPGSKVPEESQAEALLSRAFAAKHAKEIHPRVRASDTKLAVILSRKRYERIHRALEEKYPDARVNLEFVPHLLLENKGVMYASNRLPLQTEIARYLSADIKAEIERSFLPKPCKPLFGQIAWDSPWR